MLSDAGPPCFSRHADRVMACTLHQPVPGGHRREMAVQALGHAVYPGRMRPELQPKLVIRRGPREFRFSLQRYQLTSDEILLRRAAENPSTRP